MSLFVGVVLSEKYKEWEDYGFMALALAVSLPAVLIPLLIPGEDSVKPLRERYWVKANVWIFIFGFVGNYFWTHYFYKLLHATYTFPVKWQLNEVPIMLYLVTHAYFLSYHAATTPLLRKYWTSFRPSFLRHIGTILIVLAMAYFTAFMEAWTLEKVPYYHIEDRYQMYLIGSTFYGIYFIISFPMFTRIDEGASENWTLSRTAIEALASAMIVFILVDFWRLAIGGLKLGTVDSKGLPFL